MQSSLFQTQLSQSLCSDTVKPHSMKYQVFGFIFIYLLPLTDLRTSGTQAQTRPSRRTSKNTPLFSILVGFSFANISANEKTDYTW